MSSAPLASFIITRFIAPASIVYTSCKQPIFLPTTSKMSLESLQKRLTTLQETTSHIQTLIARLASFKFPPGAIPLNQGSLDTVATELSNEIHDTLKEQNNDFELLEQEIKDSPGGRKGSDAETNKLRLLERATRTQQELKQFVLPYIPNARNLANNPQRPICLPQSSTSRKTQPRPLPPRRARTPPPIPRRTPLPLLQPTHFPPPHTRSRRADTR